MKVAEAQRLVAKAGAHEVELALHIERAANHLVLPGSLQGRVGKGGPVGLVRLWKAVSANCDLKPILNCGAKSNLSKPNLRLACGSAPCDDCCDAVPASAPVARSRRSWLRFGLRFSLFGLRLDATGSVGRVLANSQREASYFLPIVIGGTR